MRIFQAFLLGLACWHGQLLAQHSSVFQVCRAGDCFYLAGTVHLLPDSEYPLPEPFIYAYQRADTLMFETEVPADTDVAAQRKMLAAMQYPAGETLSSKLSPAVRTQLDQTLRKYDLQLNQFEQFRAGFVVTQLTLLETNRLGLKGIGVDAYFENKAKFDGKARLYLESLDFQLQLLAGLADGREAELIDLTLAELPNTGRDLRMLIAAWRRGDLGQIERDVLIPTQQQDPRSYQRLFVARNELWVPQLMRLLGNTQREMVLVGTGHLAGPHGLIHLLQANGLQVTPVEVSHD